MIKIFKCKATLRNKDDLFHRKDRHPKLKVKYMKIIQVKHNILVLHPKHITAI